MREQVNFDWNCDLEWEGHVPVFDEVPECGSEDLGDELHSRTYVSMRKTDLQDMIERFSVALGFFAGVGATTNVYSKGVLAFCIVSLINPFKVKILSGKGLDPILNDAIFDEKTGEMRVPLEKFYTHCKKADLPSDIITWFSENGFCYSTETELVFRNNFKRGKIISRV